MMRWAFMLAVAVAIGGVAALFVRNPNFVSESAESFSSKYLQTDAEAQSKERPRIAPGDRTVFAAGIVEGADRETALGFEIAGRLENVLVEEGDKVKKGQELAQLDTSQWQAELEEAQANLTLAKGEFDRIKNGASDEAREVAKAEVRVAADSRDYWNNEFDRNKKLRNTGAIPQADLDKTASELTIAKSKLSAAEAREAEVKASARDDDIEIAEAKIAIADARVKQVKNLIDKATLRAPTDGLILQVRAEAGETTAPGEQEPLVTMVDVSKIHVRAFIEELDAFRVEPGQRAYGVADGKPDVKFEGTVVFASVFMVPKKTFSNTPGERVDVKVREVLIELRDNEGLVVGLPVDVFFDEKADSPVDSTEDAPGDPVAKN